MLFNIPTQTLILQFYQSFINIYSFQWKSANKNQKNAKIKHPIQIRKKLGISVGAFNLWWRHQKNNDLANFWQFSKQWHFVHKRWMTCWQKQQTSTIRQSREQRGEGNLPAPLPHHDYEGQNTPWQIGLTALVKDCLENGVLPDELKLADASPVFK